MKPTKPEDHDEHSADSPKPSGEDIYEGPPSVHDKEHENNLSGNVDSYQNHNEENHLVEPHNGADHPPSSHNTPIHQHPLEDHINGQDYVPYPPLASGPAVHHQNPLSIQQSIEYPPIHIRYTLPDKGHFDLPHENALNNDLSMYSSLLIKPGPDAETIKISTENHAGGFQLPKLETHGSFHDSPPIPNTYAALEGPLKIPLLNPYMLSPHWHNHGLIQPMPAFDLHSFYRRKSLQRRRSVDIARRMRLHRA